ncbi:hypothetical protein [Microbacterium sp. G2-8]|uniref:hypothetical protein n=1 Tax=Microbacterium sp. G2-8 TaxID=2842454 RepID=UPI001C89078B|nr:hypothetical protein [Microbacterium sp. G2-8]
MTALAVPDLAGSRARASELASELPASLAGVSVEIDVANVSAASQSFVDELCKQLLEVRSARELVVHNASPSLARHLNTSARLRGVLDRLLVDIRAAV